MLTGLQRRNHQRLVEIVGGSDHNRIHLRVCQQLRIGTIHMDSVGSGSRPADFPDIISAGKGAHITFQNLAAVPGSLSAVADHSNLFHKTVLFRPD